MKGIQLDGQSVNPLVPRHKLGALALLHLIPEVVYINDGESARPKTNSRETQSLVTV